MDRMTADAYDLSVADSIELSPPSEPMKVARTIVKTHYVDANDDLLLRHWRGGWWRWRGSHWAEVEPRGIRADLYKITENACYFAVDPKTGKAGMKPWSPNRHKIADLMESLAAITHLPETISQPTWLDERDACESTIVAVGNGLLDVGTRTLGAHTPLFFNQTAVPFDFDPDASEPKRWLGFLEQLWPGDDDSINALQEYVGYVVSGRMDLQKMLLIVGPTRAGKGAICRLIASLIGAENVAGPTMSSLGTDFGLAPLIGKPLAVISDARLSGRNVNVIVERLLSITGQDRITVNIKYKEQWNGTLPSRFVLLSNEMPEFSDASAAIIGRFVVLMLTRSWLGQEDHDLEPQMHSELTGILNWVLDGLQRLTENGRFSRPSYTDEIATTLANLASPVGAFVRDRCDLGPDLTVPIKDIYAAWKNWAERNGQRPGTTQNFGRNLRAAVPTLPVTQPGSGDNRSRSYAGIALKDDDGDDDGRPA